MKPAASLTCSACSQLILKKDLIAWTKKDNIVHLLCSTAQLNEGIHFIGRAEKLLARFECNQQHA